MGYGSIMRRLWYLPKLSIEQGTMRQMEMEMVMEMCKVCKEGVEI